MGRTLKWLLLCLLIWAAGACVGPLGRTDEGGTQGAVVVYIVNLGWHTGLVVPREEIPRGIWPERADFPDADYLEVGWGDRDFYQAPNPGVWMALKAALWPTPSVLYVSGFRGDIRLRYPRAEIIALRPSREAFERLAGFVHDSFQRTGSRASPLQGAIPAIGRFYPARGQFHLLRTCNAWTASAVRAAGYPVGRFSAIGAGSLVSAVRRFGEPVPQRGAAQASGQYP